MTWYSHVLNTLKDRLQGKVIGTTMNLSTSRASAVRQTPPVEQAGDSKNKHAIKRLLDGISPSKTKLKAQSIGLMPRLSLRPLSHEEFCTFGHVRICAVYRLRRRRLRRSRAQRTATWSVKVYREQLAFTLLFYILYRLSLLDRNDIFLYAIYRMSVVFVLHVYYHVPLHHHAAPDTSPLEQVVPSV